MSFSTTQARRELDRLERRLKKYESLLMRKRQLEAFLALADELSKKPKQKAESASPTRLKMKRKFRISDYAAQILQRGELHLDALYQQMRAQGWSGAGNPANEKKAIYVALFREPGRFTKVGRNIW